MATETADNIKLKEAIDELRNIPIWSLCFI